MMRLCPKANRGGQVGSLRMIPANMQRGKPCSESTNWHRSRSRRVLSVIAQQALDKCHAEIAAVKSIDHTRTQYAQKGGHDLKLAAR